MFIRMSLYILLLVAFFAGGVIGLGIAPPQLAWLTEIVLFLAFAFMLNQRIGSGQRIQMWGAGFVALFVSISMLSAAYNGVSIISFLLFLRLVLRFYFLMLILINSNIGESFMLGTNKLIAWFLIIQIPTSVIKLFIFGQGEQAIGTYAMHGGSNSTIIPLIAICFLISYYFLYHKSGYSILLIFGFFVFGVIGGKAGLAILIPPVVLFAIWNICRHTPGIVSYRKAINITVTACIISFLSFYSVIRLCPALNPSRRVWGTFSFQYLRNYIPDREMRIHDGRATGRIAAVMTTANYLQEKGVAHILLGLGPGMTTVSIFKSYNKDINEQYELGIAYGITGLVWLPFQVGYLGTIVWLSFYLYILMKLQNYVRHEQDTYWKAFQVSMMCFTFVVLLVSCVYTIHVIIGDVPSLIYMLLVGFSIKRHYQCHINANANTVLLKRLKHRSNFSLQPVDYRGSREVFGRSI